MAVALGPRGDRMIETIFYAFSFIGLETERKIGSIVTSVMAMVFSFKGD